MGTVDWRGNISGILLMFILCMFKYIYTYITYVYNVHIRVYVCMYQTETNKSAFILLTKGARIAQAHTHYYMRRYVLFFFIICIKKA